MNHHEVEMQMLAETTFASRRACAIYLLTREFETLMNLLSDDAATFYIASHRLHGIVMALMWTSVIGKDEYTRLTDMLEAIFSARLNALIARCGALA